MGRLMRGLLIGGLIWAGGRWVMRGQAMRMMRRNRGANGWVPFRRAALAVMGGRPSRLQVAMDAGRAAVGGILRLLTR